MKTASDRQKALRAKKDTLTAKLNVLALQSAKKLQEEWSAAVYPAEECFGVWPLS